MSLWREGATTDSASRHEEDAERNQSSQVEYFNVNEMINFGMKDLRYSVGAVQRA